MFRNGLLPQVTWCIKQHSWPFAIHQNGLHLVGGNIILRYSTRRIFVSKSTLPRAFWLEAVFLGLDSQQRMTIFLQRYRFTHNTLNYIEWFGQNKHKCTRCIVLVMIISAWNFYGPYHHCGITYVMAWVYNSIIWVSVAVWRISQE